MSDVAGSGAARRNNERSDRPGAWGRWVARREADAAYSVTRIMGRMRAPLLVSALAVAVFGFTGQIQEIYRLFAEDFTFTDGFTLEQLRFVSFFIALYLVSFTLWYVSRVLTLTDDSARLALGERSWSGWTVRWAPRLIGAAPAFAASYGMATAAQGESADAAGLYGAALAALVIGALRLFMSWRRRRGGRALDDASDIGDGPFRMRLRLAAGAVIVAGVAYLMTQPIAATQAVGALTIICFFLLALVFVYAQATHLYDRFALPIIAVMLVAVAVLAAFDLNDNHFLREREPGAAEIEQRLALKREAEMLGPPIPITIESSFREWYAARADRAAYRAAGKKYPVYVVAAQGGGVYAAYQSAVFLARMQDLCPSFATHLFGVSGVSGGSVGAAAYSALVKEYAENRAIGALSEACGRLGAPQPSGEERSAEARRDARGRRIAFRAHRMLSQDFLSPLISAMLFPDFTARFSPVAIPSFDRARALEFAVERSWDVGVASPRGGAAGDAEADAPTAANRLREGLLEYWSPEGVAPALFLNATETETGRRIVFSPIPDLGPSIRSYQLAVAPREDGLTPDLRLSTAAVASARFPYVTPAASMALRAVEGEDGTWPKLRLVDGGYFENSGVDTAMAVVEQIQAIEALRDEIEVRLIVFDLTRDRFRGASYSFSEVLAPISTILNATVARSTLAQARARAQLESECRYVALEDGAVPGASEEDAFAKICPAEEVARGAVWSVSLNDYEYDFQLGWILSKKTLNRIRDQLGDPRLCEPQAARQSREAAPTPEAALRQEPEPAADADPSRREEWRRRREERLQRLADDAVSRHNSCIARFVMQSLSGEL